MRHPRPTLLLTSGLAAALALGAALAGGPAAGAPAPAPAPAPAASTSPVPARWAAAVSTPRADPYYPAKGDPRLDALHYRLDLSWAPRRRLLHGTTTLVFRATTDTRRVRLDLGRPLEVTEVSLDGSTVRADHPGNHLVVRAGATLAADSVHRLVISYHGSPRPVSGPATRDDVARVGWRTEADGQVWTMQEPYGALTWFPVSDHPSDKAFYDARVSVPRKWTGIFNGTLRHTKRTAHRTVTRWRLHDPAAAYLVTLAIGDYVRQTRTGPHGLRVQNWLPSDADATLRRHAARVGRLVGWLEGHLGRYPFDQAGVVVVPGGRRWRPRPWSR